MNIGCEIGVPSARLKKSRCLTQLLFLRLCSGFGFSASIRLNGFHCLSVVSISSPLLCVGRPELRPPGTRQNRELGGPGSGHPTKRLNRYPSWIICFPRSTPSRTFAGRPLNNSTTPSRQSVRCRFSLGQVRVVYRLQKSGWVMPGPVARRGSWLPQKAPRRQRRRYQ